MVGLSPYLTLLRRLRDGGQAGAARKELATLHAEAFALAGSLAFELYDTSGAYGFYEEATLAAHEAAEPWVAGYVMTNVALTTLYANADYGRALRAAEHAYARAVRSRSKNPVLWSGTVYAEIAALVDDARTAKATLDGMIVAAEARSGEPDPLGMHFSHARLVGRSGVVDLRLNRLSNAATQLEYALAREWRPIFALDLASIRVREGEPEAAAQLVAQAATKISTVHRRVGRQRLGHVRAQLKAFEGERWLRDLDYTLARSGRT